MTRTAVILLLSLSANCYAETTPHQEFSFLSSFFQMLAALAIVVGLILVTRHYSGKLFKGFLPGQQAVKYIRLVETRFIGPKKSLLLIEVGGEYLLLGSTDDKISLIKTVDVIEDIELVSDPVSLREGFSTLFKVKGREGDGDAQPT